MQRNGAAEPVRRHDLRRIDLVDVDEVEPLGDREIRRLGRVTRELLEDRARAADERVDVGTGGDAQERVAEAVALAHRVALDQAVRIERRQQAPGGAAVEHARLGQLDDGRRAARVGDRLEERRRPVDRLDRARAPGPERRASETGGFMIRVIVA